MTTFSSNIRPGVTPLSGPSPLLPGTQKLTLPDGQKLEEDVKPFPQTQEEQLEYRQNLVLEHAQGLMVQRARLLSELGGGKIASENETQAHERLMDYRFQLRQSLDEYRDIGSSLQELKDKRDKQRADDMRRFYGSNPYRE